MLYQLANLHIALVRDYLCFANEAETLGLACTLPRGMWQKPIFVCDLIYRTSLLFILLSCNEFEGQTRDNCRLVARES